MHDGWPFTFACHRSGNCCARPEGRVRVREDEIPGLASLLGLSVAGVRSRFLNPGPRGNWLVRLAPGGACPFLSRDGYVAACSVYAARPEPCRSFPFWEELRAPGPTLAEALRFCPGLRPRLRSAEVRADPGNEGAPQTPPMKA